MISLSESIKNGIYEHGVVNYADKNIFAYEVNGFGDYRLIDDANLPSLLSLPYMGFISQEDPIYKSTR